MKYRTKLYIALVSIALASSLVALFIFSSETEKLLFKMLRSRALSIVATTAVQLDPDLVLASTKVTSTEDPTYVKLRDILRKVVNTNRREDLFVADLYLLYVDPQHPNVLLYGVESDPIPDLPTSPYTDSDKDLILKNLYGYLSDPTFITDQYGVWLSSFAPIKDKEGQYIATLGLSLNAVDIQLSLQKLLRFALIGLGTSLVLSLITAFFLSKKVTHSLDHLCRVVKEIEQGNLTAEAHLETQDEFGELSDRINAMRQGLQERERLKMSFARYVSKHILEKILTAESSFKLEGERRKVTVLFSDIRHFTELSERLPPEKVVQLLNEYFAQMIEVIFSHSGTLDKFIGDGIMAEFGAPLDDISQEEHALLAAIDMQKALTKLCKKWADEQRPTIEIGIGIHTGEAIVGNIGSDRRVEYTAIGDTVNIAARLEQATKILKTPILLSETTYLAIKDKFSFIDLGTMNIIGRKEQIKVYTIDKEKHLS